MRNLHQIKPNMSDFDWAFNYYIYNYITDQIRKLKSGLVQYYDSYERRWRELTVPNPGEPDYEYYLDIWRINGKQKIEMKLKQEMD